jgi:2-methylcitrate dehydratase PrpD
MNTASDKIASFVTSFPRSTLSSGQLHLVTRALFDTLVCALAGSKEPASTIALQYGSGQSALACGTVWATGETLPIELAALVNGTMGHALDYDDVSSPLRGHPSVAMFPALLALGESLDASGQDLLDAYAVGFEVCLRMARAMVDDHYAKGWHSTSSIASLGAVAACARLLKLTRQQCVNALGIAVAQIAGSRQNFGTMTKPFQAGQANALALRAIGLARLGFDASAEALDGAQGYSALYADGADLSGQLDQLGTLPLELDSSGIEVKKYPLGYATHRTLDGVMDLLGEFPTLRLSEIDCVEVTTNYRATVPLIYASPQTGLEGKFSMQYAVVAALLDRKVGLTSFEDSAVQRPEVQAFLSRVTVREGAPPLFPRWASLRVVLRNGQVLAKRVDQLRGSKELPLSDAELIAKGIDCCAYGRPSVDAERLAHACFSLPQQNLSSVLAALKVSA